METSRFNLKAPAFSVAQKMTYKIHVLLVDHDSNVHAPLIDMFEYFSYKVTTAKHASTALSILSKEKPKFDVLMETINSHDAYGFKLLQDVVQMDLPVILLLDEDDVLLTKRALEVGALLCIKKPVSMEIAKYLWQLVAWEKEYRLNKIERLRELMRYDRLHNGVEEEDIMRGYLSDNTSSEESYKRKKKIKCRGSGNQDTESNFEHHDIIRFKGNVWTQWTQELHEKFMDAVRKLGEGKCYPKEILELMNVPGLTRMQVASHLQKCRHGTWQPPNERKSKTALKTKSRKTSSPAKSNRFGSMPILGNNIPRNNCEGFPQEGYRTQLHIIPDDSNGYNNIFSNSGIETSNMDHMGLTLGIDDTFLFDEKFVIDAQSVAAPIINTSFDQRNTTGEYFEFPTMDSMIQDFYNSEQEPIGSWGCT